MEEYRTMCGKHKASTCLSFVECVAAPVGVRLADVEGKIEIAARRQVTNKLREAYRSAAKHDKARILDLAMATTGMGRSTARRMLTGPRLPDPGEQTDRRRLRPKRYSDESRLLLEHVWA